MRTIISTLMANSLALESNETTQSIETEIIVYCKINNFDGLQKASIIETHEQLETAFKNGTRCRVRRTTKTPIESVANQSSEANNDTYCFTFKIPTSSEEGFEANQEFNIEVDKDFFDGFKSIADQRVLKTRYKFSTDSIVLTYTKDDEKHDITVPDVTYEVDVYADQNGQIYEWCKIDVEVDGVLNYLSVYFPELKDIKLNIKISHLPFEPSDSILTQSATGDQKEFIDSLWKEHYQLPVTVNEST